MNCYRLLLTTALCGALAIAQQTISTYAGGGPNNLPATQANLAGPAGLAQDSAGNTYVVDGRNYRVFKIGSSGTLTVVAGNGLRANTIGEGDGGPAIAAELFAPQAIAVDAAGNIFITDNDRVREIKAADGSILTYAGGGTAGRGDGGAANQAALLSPVALAVDSSGNLYIGDTSDRRVRRVDAQTLTITTVAGGGVGATPAQQTSLPGIQALAVDGADNLYIADVVLAEVLRMSPDTGAIATVAGSTTGAPLTTGGVPASSVALDVYGLAVDGSGNMFAINITSANTDNSWYSLIEVNDSGMVSILAGIGSGGALVAPPNDFGGPAKDASMEPTSIVVQSNGTLLVSDANYHYIYTIAGGIINGFAGNGTETFAGDSAPATNATLLSPIYPNSYPGITSDASGNLFFADNRNNRVREIRASDGTIVTVAGNGSNGNNGDGNLVTQAEVGSPTAVAVDASGDLFIAQSDRIREVSAATGKIQTVAGGGTNSSEGAPALQASITPYAVAVDGAGDIFFSDGHEEVHEVSAATGDVTTYAGGGTDSGDGGPATAASLQKPEGITLDAAGNLYIAEYGEHDNNADNPGAIREVVAKTGVIETVASGVGNPAAVTLDAAGNMFIADASGDRIWVVPVATTTPELLAGTGAQPGDFSGDLGPALDAQLDSPTGLALDNEGSLQVEDSGSLRVRKITNAAGLPVASLAPASLNFGSQNEGVGSAVQNVTLTNTGVGDLAISSIVISGANADDFSTTASTTCATGQILVAGASCTLAISFQPSVTGSESATVTITDDATPTTQTIALSGTGVAAGVSIAPPSVSFGNETVAETSKAVTLTVTNAGTADLNFSAAPALSGPNAADFAIASGATCTNGTTLAASKTCTVSLTFKPSVNGAESATLTLADNADPTTQTVSLAGNGVLPFVALAPGSITFPSQPQGTASTASTVTVTNQGPGDLIFTAIAVSGGFAADFTLSSATTCSTTAIVASGTSCTLGVIFTPSTTTTESALLNLGDNASSAAQTVTLSGSGSPAAPLVSLAPATLTFASQAVGTTSAAQNATLMNTGSAALSITSIAASGDFAQSNTCGSSQGANKSCTIAVTFAPTAAGSRSGTLTITDNASGSPHTITLAGTATAAAPAAALSPATLTFTSQLTGSTSPAQTITLANSGAAALAITTIAASGDFAETNTCGSTVAAGQSCTISVTFTPTATGNRTGTLTVTDNASGSPQTAALTGAGADLTIGPSSGSNTSATVSAGGTTSYDLSFTPVNGATGTFALACAGAPQGATCTPTPASISLSGSSAAQVTVAVTTTARSLLPPAGVTSPRGNSPWWPVALLMLLAATGFAWRRRRRLILSSVGFAALSLMLACGGGSASAPPPPPPSNTGTPAGTYTLTITATSGKVTRTTNLTLVVN